MADCSVLTSAAEKVICISSDISPLSIEYGLAFITSVTLLVYLVASIVTLYFGWSQRQITDFQFVIGLMKGLLIFSCFIIYFFATHR